MFVIIFSLLVMTWITAPLHGISIALSTIVAVTILFLPGVDILKWNETLNNINWGIPILFASGIAIAYAFEKSNLVSIISQIGITYLGELNHYFIVLTIILFLLFCRLIFTNYNAMVASILPIIILTADDMNINPLWLGLLALSMMSSSYILPSQSVGNLIMMSKEYYRPAELIKTGSLLTVLVTGIYTILAFLYWPLLNFSPW